MVVGGLLMCAAAGAMYLLPAGVPGLLAARLVLGFGDAWVYIAGVAWIIDLAPEHRRGQAIALFGTAIWGGTTVGPLVGHRTGVGVVVEGLVTALAAHDDVAILPYVLSMRARLEPGVRRLPVPAAAAHRAWGRVAHPRVDRWLAPATIVHGAKISHGDRKEALAALGDDIVWNGEPIDGMSDTDAAALEAVHAGRA